MAASEKRAVIAPAQQQGTLLDQWRLALTIASDPRLSRGDVAIALHIIDRFFKSKGNTRASFELLAGKAGVCRRTVIYSLKRLLDAGYFDVLNKGRRGRATEYLPNFALGREARKKGATDCTAKPEKGAADCTLTDEKKRAVDCTEKPENGATDCTLNAERGAMDCTPTYLHPPADKPGGQVSRTSSEEGTRGAASPPPLGAASGAGADTPRDPVVGFDELWAAYPNRKQRPKAKDAYRKLAPDAATHAQMVAAAQAVAAYHQDNNVDLRWCPYLHNWIAGERYLEDTPTPHQDPKTAAIANRRGRKTKAKKPNDAVPVGEYRALIVTSDWKCGAAGKDGWLVEFEIMEGEHQGRRVAERIKVGEGLSNEDAYIARCQISTLARLTGSKPASDSSQLLGIEVILGVNAPEDGGLRYEPAPPAS